jgi:hypothetical protein
MLYADLYATRGRLRYVDPEGAGAVAWTYRLSIPPGGRVIGARCPSPAPIRFVDLPSFTEASSLPIRFQLIKPTSPATVDLRWRSTGAWISPPTWRALPLSQYATISGLAPGRTYCFAARANTRSGVSLWTPPSCTTRLLAATESLPSAGWQGFTGRAGFYLGSFALASSAGATLTATGAFGRLAVDAYHCARCGVIDVYAGPRRLGVLNLAAPPLNTLVLWTSVALPLHTYTVTLRVASLGRVVAVDGIGMQP